MVRVCGQFSQLPWTLKPWRLPAANYSSSCWIPSLSATMRATWLCLGQSTTSVRAHGSCLKPISSSCWNNSRRQISKETCRSRKVGGQCCSCTSTSSREAINNWFGLHLYPIATPASDSSKEQLLLSGGPESVKEFFDRLSSANPPSTSPSARASKADKEGSQREEFSKLCVEILKDLKSENILLDFCLNIPVLKMAEKGGSSLNTYLSGENGHATLVKRLVNNTVSCFECS